jgi:di/tricarboxylate transporter
MEIVVVTIILAAALALLVTDALPVDLTSLGIMVALVVTGILPPAEAVAGFANPAPLTVGALFVVGRGLVRTGSLDFLDRALSRWTAGRPLPLLIATLFATGTISAFVNNTPVVILFTAVLIGLCARLGLAPSKYLLPVSYVSILAGTSTLIGTSTNIIVSDLYAAHGFEPLGMFELTRLGFPLALAGLALLLLLSFRLLPRHHAPTFEPASGDHHKYLSELLVPEGSPLAGREPVAALAERFPEVEVYEVIQGEQVCDPTTDVCRVAAQDILLVKAEAGDLARLLQERLVSMPIGENGAPADPLSRKSVIVELIVPPSSRLLGRRLDDAHLGFGQELRVLGVKRRQVHYSAQKMSSLHLGVGDILLVQCPVEDIDLLRGKGDVIVVEEVDKRIVDRRRAPFALVIFAGMVAAAATGVAGILACALTAAFLMIVTGCLSLRSAYAAVDVRVLVLIIGTIALGTALQKTGAADLYADRFLALFVGLGTRGVLAAIIVLTSVLSHVLSNNATAVLLVPIGISTALTLGVDPRSFVVGICFGASACFASPFGYQTNMLVLGPGGYRFTDYLKLGMPLNLLVWVGSSLAIPVLWPF